MGPLWAHSSEIGIPRGCSGLLPLLAHFSNPSARPRAGETRARGASGSSTPCPSPWGAKPPSTCPAPQQAGGCSPHPQPPFWEQESVEEHPSIWFWAVLVLLFGLCATICYLLLPSSEQPASPSPCTGTSCSQELEPSGRRGCTPSSASLSACLVSFLPISPPKQDEKNQMMTTNVWLKQVGAWGAGACQGGQSIWGRETLLGAAPGCSPPGGVMPEEEEDEEEGTGQTQGLLMPPVPPSRSGVTTSCVGTRRTSTTSPPSGCPLR